MSRFYTEALAGTLIDWINRKDELKREVLIEQVSSVIRESLNRIINAKCNAENREFTGF